MIKMCSRLSILLLLLAYTISSCEDEDLFAPIKNANLEDIIETKITYFDSTLVNTDTILAGSTLRIKTQLVPEEVESEFSEVTFLVVDALNSDTKIFEQKKSIDINNDAEVIFRLPIKSRDILITASIGSGVKYTTENYLQVRPIDGLIKADFESQTTTNQPILADGTSTVALNLSLSTSVGAQMLSISQENPSCRTLSGSGEVTLNDQEIKKVRYSLPQTPGVACVEVTIDGSTEYTEVTTLEIDTAFADRLAIEATLFRQDSTATNTITVFPRRNTGKVSIGLPLTFAAYQMIGGQRVDVGRFLGINDAITKADEKNQVSFLLDNGAPDPAVPITIEATMQGGGSAGPDLVARTEIFYKVL